MTDRTTLMALGGSALLVVVAALAGLIAGGLAAPKAPPSSSPSAPPVAAPARAGALGDEQLFRQPLTAGCATTEAVWVVSQGGGIGRFDGERWSLVDPTLRSLSAAVCVRDVMLAVGGAGRVLTANDTERTVRVDTAQLDDLNAVSALPDGVLAVGSRGTVLRQVPDGWGEYAAGLTEDLHGVVAFSATSAWAVGAGGVTYRLEPRGWLPVPSGVTETLRAVAGTSADNVIAVGDAGTVLVWQGRWKKLEVGTPADLRAVARAAGVTWVGGDGGTVLRITNATPEAARFDLRTTCAIRGVFLRGAEVWFVGSDGSTAGVWRVAGERIDRWGLC